MANENAIQATGTFITRKGLSLITKLVADKGTLSFSRGAVGVGRPPEGYSPDSMIALSSYKMDAEIADYGVQDDKAFVTLQISSDQVAEGFLLTEVGLYATDPDEGEVLYAYMDISTDPTYIYANGSATRTKFAEFTLYVLIGTVERVTAAVTPGSIITKDTFKADKLPVSDTSGILGEIGKVATGQAMFDALAHKVVEELVTNNDLIATLASYVTTEALTTKLAEYILKNKIVDNFLATSADTVLSGTMGAELKRLLDVLNTNFDDRSGVTDLFAVADIGLNARRMVRYNANTLNSPFKAGLTGTIDSGLAIITMGSSGNYGTILCIPEGGIYTSSCVCKKTMVWGDWEQLITAPNIQAGSVNKSVPASSLIDIPIVFKTPFSTVPIVVVSLNGRPSAITAWCYCYAHSITSTGFSIRITNVWTGESNPAVNWFACPK